MQETFKISMLLDFYGKLITARQYEIIDMHFNEDYSLGEIAERLKISRQGVYDNIRKGSMILNEFEIKLGLIERNNNNQIAYKHVDKEIDYLLNMTDDIKIIEKLINIKKDINNIAE